MAEDAAALFAEFGATDITALTKTQKIVAKRLSASWTTIPHVTHHDDLDVTALETYRASRSKADRLTALPFVIEAIVDALKTFPHFNASLSEDGAHLVRKQYYHIGIAIDVPGGLVVGVVRDCDRKPATQIADEVRDLSERARAGRLSYDAMTGGSFSISSLGSIGGTGFTPIINAPEVAILGLGRTRTAAVWNGTAFEPRDLLPASLSYDHRVINGADAAKFLRHVGDRLSEVGKP